MGSITEMRIFVQGTEIEQLYGSVVNYMAQGIVKVDAEIGQKGRLCNGNQLAMILVMSL